MRQECKELIFLSDLLVNVMHSDFFSNYFDVVIYCCYACHMVNLLVFHYSLSYIFIAFI